MTLSHEQVIAETREWIEKAVIGLNLCPFAKAVHVKNQIRYAVSDARNTDRLLEDLDQALHDLAQASPDDVDTVLLIHPHVLNDFLDYNDFLELADGAVEELGYEGVLQVASFHPDYQFAETTPHDIANYSNRSPYPMLHLLREASIEAAVKAFPQAETIYEKNIETLRALGIQGLNALGLKRRARGDA